MRWWVENLETLGKMLGSTEVLIFGGGEVML